MPTILVIIEDQPDGAIESAAAARSISAAQTVAAVCGATETEQQFLATLFDKVIAFPASADGNWDSEYAAACFLPLIEQLRPFAVLMQHTNNGLDLAPLLAAKSNRPMLADCLSLEVREQGLGAVRTMFGGKVHARVSATESTNGYLATLRPGAFTTPEVAAIEGMVEAAEAPAGFRPRRRCIETLTPDAGAVDITQAQTLIAVGRGIEDDENLEIVEGLADALGGELACTRPVVDKQWLEKSRQVGTSGLTVKPKIYITVGVSGSFQHLGGVKGGPFMVAINQDAAAPIFATADVGIVGDLFDLVPLLEEKIRERKG